MAFTALIGIAGAIILVVGAALPDTPVKHARQSLKDWFFALGGAVMLLCSILNYVAGGAIFFIFLQVLVNIASIFMMLDVNDRIGAPLIAVAGAAFILWSILLYQGMNTIFFIIGLSGIGMGYVMTTGTVRREVALTVGSVLIALFSYKEGNLIFFWLNAFFAIFSFYYIYKNWQRDAGKGKNR